MTIDAYITIAILALTFGLLIKTKLPPATTPILPLPWRNSRRRKPLILKGARQVGKTYSIRRFGETGQGRF